MPYRRLPNTDQARIRALKAVVVKGDICTGRQQAFARYRTIDDEMKKELVNLLS